jgi:hypothetical protein
VGSVRCEGGRCPSATTRRKARNDAKASTSHVHGGHGGVGTDRGVGLAVNTLTCTTDPCIANNNGDSITSTNDAEEIRALDGADFVQPPGSGDEVPTCPPPL